MDWKMKIMIAGGVLGALVGVGAAMIYIREAEESLTGEAPRVAPGEAVRLGVTLMDVMRQVASIGAKGL
jgi:hypothetical protein